MASAPGPRRLRGPGRFQQSPHEGKVGVDVGGEGVRVFVGPVVRVAVAAVVRVAVAAVVRVAEGMGVEEGPVVVAVRVSVRVAVGPAVPVRVLVGVRDGVRVIVGVRVMV